MSLIPLANCLLEKNDFFLTLQFSFVSLLDLLSPSPKLSFFTRSSPPFVIRRVLIGCSGFQVVERAREQRKGEDRANSEYGDDLFNQEKLFRSVCLYFRIVCIKCREEPLQTFFCGLRINGACVLCLFRRKSKWLRPRKCFKVPTKSRVQKKRLFLVSWQVQGVSQVAHLFYFLQLHHFPILLMVVFARR